MLISKICIFFFNIGFIIWFFITEVKTSTVSWKVWINYVSKSVTYILLSVCPIIHFSDCPTRILTTVTTYHQGFSISFSRKSYSFTHFLLATSSFSPSPTSLPQFMVLPWPLLSLLLSPILYQLSYHTPRTVNSLFALKKWRKKIET